mgnify:CR=1 FL=1
MVMGILSINTMSQEKGYMDIKEFQEETTIEAFHTGLKVNMSCTSTCHWGHV